MRVVIKQVIPASDWRVFVCRFWKGEPEVFEIPFVSWALVCRTFDGQDENEYGMEPMIYRRDGCGRAELLSEAERCHSMSPNHNFINSVIVQPDEPFNEEDKEELIKEARRFIGYHITELDALLAGKKSYNYEDAMQEYKSFAAHHPSWDFTRWLQRTRETWVDLLTKTIDDVCATAA